MLKFAPARRHSAVFLAVIYIFLLFGLLFPLNNTIRAQEATGARVVLNALSTDDFPNISAFLNVRDNDGHFIHGLRPVDIRIYEDNVMLSVQKVDEMRPGAQIVVAINPGSSFAIQNAQGLSRYDFLIAALNDWGKSRMGSNTDDLSLLTTGVGGISHTQDIDEWLRALNAGQVDARTAEPNLDTLAQAIKLASDQTPRPGMGRTVLFITAPMEAPASEVMENIVALARESDVALNVWVVGAPATANTQFSKQLQAIVEATQGDFYVFAADEVPPNLETYFEQQRDIYQIQYTSQVRDSGKHSVLVEVTVNTQAVKSNLQEFDIEIQPPRPVFVSPPLEIVRKPPPETEEVQSVDENNPYKAFVPQTQVLEFVIDFPDGRLRSIVNASLFVDEEQIVEIIQPPFDKFVWDLSEYSVDATHQLQVKVEDELGLMGESSIIPIDVLIQVPEKKPLERLKENTPMLTGIAVLFAGLILLLVLVLGGRLTPRMPAVIANRRVNSDPVTQPVQIREEPKRKGLSGLSDRLRLRRKVLPPAVVALLFRLSETDEAIDATPIPISAVETTFGTDPEKATIVLTDPSVDPLHARLTRQPDGSFRLADNNTIAGTWVNYTPVSANGARLEHGDLIHIGRVGFRFMLRKPPTVHISVKQVDTESEASEEEDSE